ncbi:MAG: hypothetical protein WC554_09165 [Clostridia bacterium]
MKNKTATFIVFILIIFSVIGYFARIKPHIDEFNQLKRNKVFEDTMYLWKKGATSTFGPNGFNNPKINYDLRSWDAGKNWYLINNDFETYEFKIIGLVDTIYPGLIEHLKSWDKMTEYVTKNGPIKLNDLKGLKILNDAGFTVTRKEIKNEN